MFHDSFPTITCSSALDLVIPVDIKISVVIVNMFLHVWCQTHGSNCKLTRLFWSTYQWCTSHSSCIAMFICFTTHHTDVEVAVEHVMLSNASGLYSLHEFICLARILVKPLLSLSVLLMACFQAQ